MNIKKIGVSFGSLLIASIIFVCWVYLVEVHLSDYQTFIGAFITAWASILVIGGVVVGWALLMVKLWD